MFICCITILYLSIIHTNRRRLLFFLSSFCSLFLFSFVLSYLLSALFFFSFFHSFIPSFLSCSFTYLINSILSFMLFKQKTFILKYISIWSIPAKGLINCILPFLKIQTPDEGCHDLLQTNIKTIERNSKDIAIKTESNLDVF